MYYLFVVLLLFYSLDSLFLDCVRHNETKVNEGLTGTIPAEISELTALTELALSECLCCYGTQKCVVVIPMGSVLRLTFIDCALQRHHR